MGGVYPEPDLTVEQLFPVHRSALVYFRNPLRRASLWLCGRAEGLSVFEDESRRAAGLLPVSARIPTGNQPASTFVLLFG